MEKAKIINNVCLVDSFETLPNGIGVLMVKCDDSDCFLSLPKALSYKGKQFGKTGWNSDRYIAYYRTDRELCFAV